MFFKYCFVVHAALHVSCLCTSIMMIILIMNIHTPDVKSIMYCVVKQHDGHTLDFTDFSFVLFLCVSQYAAQLLHAHLLKHNHRSLTPRTGHLTTIIIFSPSNLSNRAVLVSQHPDLCHTSSDRQLLTDRGHPFWHRMEKLTLSHSFLAWHTALEIKSRYDDWTI